MREEKLRAGFYVTTRKRAERFGKYDPKIAAYYWDQGELEQYDGGDADPWRLRESGSIGLSSGWLLISLPPNK